MKSTVYYTYINSRVRVMVFNATFNNISIRLLWTILLVETEVLTCRKLLTNFIT
jgi:hypothetical protein